MEDALSAHLNHRANIIKLMKSSVLMLDKLKKVKFPNRPNK